MTFRPKVPKETIHERIERQFKAQMAFYDHRTARTQAARDLIAKESRESSTNSAAPLDK